MCVWDRDGKLRAEVDKLWYVQEIRAPDWGVRKLKYKECIRFGESGIDEKLRGKVGKEWCVLNRMHMLWSVCGIVMDN